MSSKRPPEPGTEKRPAGTRHHLYTNAPLPGSGQADAADGNGSVSTEEDELALYREKRERYQRRKRARRRFAAVVLLLAVLTGLVWLNVGTLAPQSVADRTENLLDGMGWGKSLFPVSFNQGTFQAAVPVGNDLGVLTDTTFLLYSQNGRCLAARPQGMTDPVAVSCGSKALLYDRSGKQFRVETRFGEPFTASANEPITTAAGAQNGSFAIVTQSEDYLSELKVYDNAYKNIFQWDCAQGRILCAALNPAGNKLAAVVVGARGGALFSDIYFFRIGSAKPFAVKAYDGELLYSIRYRSDGTVSAVGESKTVFLKDGRQTAVYDYGSRELLKSSNAEPLILVFGGVNGQSQAVSLSASGKLLGQAGLPGTPVAVSAGGGYAAFISGGRLYASPQSLKGLKTVSAANGVLGAVTMQGKAFLFGAQFAQRRALG